MYRYDNIILIRKKQNKKEATKSVCDCVFPNSSENDNSVFKKCKRKNNMKIKIKSVQKLTAIRNENGKVKDYKEGMKHEINDIVEVKTINELNKYNEHYANLYGCDEVYLEAVEIQN